MQQRQPVNAILADPRTDGELHEQLQRAEQLLDFAQRELAMPAGDSYQSLVEVGGPVTWNVIATPELSLKAKRWCFLVAGCVSYRGYFDRDKALAFAQKLEARGLDVAVLPAAAYSTLGWFDDPLLDTMLQQDPADLAGILFHELAHQRLYVRNDTVFNEAYASFVESAGVERWIGASGQAAPAASSWQARQAAAVEFSELIEGIRQDLAAVYESGQPEQLQRRDKAIIFDRLRSDYQALVRDAWGGKAYFSGWFQGELNNAHLIAVGAYTGGRCAFERLLQEANGEFDVFHGLAAGVARQSREERRAWLSQPCTVIAPNPEL